MNLRQALKKGNGQASYRSETLVWLAIQGHATARVACYDARSQRLIEEQYLSLCDDQNGRLRAAMGINWGPGRDIFSEWQRECRR